MASEEAFYPSVDEPTEERPAFNNDSPLLDFWADGAGWGIRGGISKSSGKRWQRIEFHFTGVEPIASTDPYVFPVAELSVFYPEKRYKQREGEGSNEWDTLAQSIREQGFEGQSALDELMGGKYVEGQPTPQGPRQHWKREPVLIRVGPDANKASAAQEAGDPNWEVFNTWHDETQLTWKVLEVEGSVASVISPNGFNAVEYALGLLDGKTMSQFLNVAMDDEKIRSSTGLMTEMTERRFVPTMKDLGRVTEDTEGVFHVK